jgi:holliday junction DNA helicase RuvB
LARIVMSEVGVTEPVEVLGQSIGSISELNRLLMDIEDYGGVLFIDEVHTLPVSLEVALLRAMENGEIFLDGDCRGAKPKMVKIPPLTLLAATTEEYLIMPPLMNRFQQVLRLTKLTTSEIAQLLRQRIAAVGVRIEADDVVSMVATRSKGIPRNAIRLMQSCYRVARSEGSEIVRVADVNRTFELEGLDPLGLSPTEQLLLKMLADAGGGPVRVNVLASRLGLPMMTISNVIETYLVQEGLIDKTNDGRILTQKGWEHVRSSHGL